MVRVTGFEPAHHKALEPNGSVTTLELPFFYSADVIISRVSTVVKFFFIRKFLKYRARYNCPYFCLLMRIITQEFQQNNCMNSFYIPALINL